MIRYVGYWFWSKNPPSLIGYRCDLIPALDKPTWHELEELAFAVLRKLLCMGEKEIGLFFVTSLEESLKRRILYSGFTVNID